MERVRDRECESCLLIPTGDRCPGQELVLVGRQKLLMRNPGAGLWFLSQGPHIPALVTQGGLLNTPVKSYVGGQ